jgi:hypothetical protein
MPLTASGEKVMGNMKKEYGEKKGKSVFYASINKGKAGSSKWHLKKPGRAMGGSR